MESIKGLKVAILVADGFEEVEMLEPRKALDKAGAKTSVVSPKKDEVRSWKLTNGAKISP
jgi:protease I